jgi:signal transduction histidine kinase/DNA-binding response OmpR family regulator
MNEVIKLLVIDDDEVDRLQLKRSLTKSGLRCEITECDDLQKVSSAVLAFNFDCIFLDYLLPGENGLSLLRKIRNLGVNTPIVIITSQGSERIAVELMKAGASDYIVKDQINETSIGKIITTILRASIAEREKEKAVQALKISEARLAEAQRIAKIGSWEIDVSSGTVYWSDETYIIFEQSKEAFVPTLGNYAKFIDPTEIDICKSELARALQGNNINIDLTIYVPSGSKSINVQGYAVQNDNNTDLKVFGTIQDITERKRTELELLNARKLAENSLNVKELFLANMSHEIRTPMNAVIGFTQLLYETPLSNEQKGFVDAIRFSGDNLLVIINDILDLSKIQSGKMKFEKIEFDLIRLLKSVNTALTSKAESKGLRLNLDLDQDVPTFIIGDPVRLNQILTNLINNAVKFTERGYVALQVHVKEQNDESVSIAFNVKDTGIGIPTDKQGHVFESFVQGSNETSRKYGGTGLGLTIVKNLIELQGGTITLNSSVGIGSTFTVTLTFEKASNDNMHGKEEVDFFGMESLQDLENATILVVEDNHVNQLLVKRVLDKTGCHVDIVSNGLESITSIKTGKYDLVLMDLQMPEMDGYAATKYIRTNLPAPLCDIPIIAMTAHALTSEIDRCIAIGMNDYISKPFKQEVLFSKIAKIINKGLHRIHFNRNKIAG